MSVSYSYVANTWSLWCIIIRITFINCYFMHTLSPARFLGSVADTLTIIGCYGQSLMLLSMWDCQRWIQGQIVRGQGRTNLRPRPDILAAKARQSRGQGQAFSRSNQGLSNPIHSHSPVRNSKLRTAVKQQMTCWIWFWILDKTILLS